jgi:hypothetical protein
MNESHAEPAGRWRVTDVPAQLDPALAELFRSAFDHDMSPELWHWKYGAGRGNSVATFDGQRLVAHYGGIYRPGLALGRPIRLVQIADVMVRPESRGILTRRGAFFRAATYYAEHYVGPGRPGELAFGFPNRKAARLGALLRIYAPMDQLVEYQWQPGRDWRCRAYRARPLQALAESVAARVVERLWRAMSRDLAGALVAVRDWGYLCHRYLEHPTHRYQVLVVSRFASRPCGVIVLRCHQEACELLDLIGPLAMVPALVAKARQFAAARGMPRLYAWMTRSHGAALAAAGGEERPLDIEIPTIVWGGIPIAPELKGRWWLTSGDTDFH